MSLPSARSRRAGHASTKFPTQQLFILALCRICEPIAFMSIFPYVYYMVSSFHVTDNEKTIALYAGMVTSAFAFAEFSTSIVWGKLSDKFGRKPILLSGLAGTGLSMVLFGFAPNLATALIARALGGLLNGNIGVLNTTVAEVVTVEKHQSRAFSIMPGVWCIGSIIGSGLGGTLADPVRSYPLYFAPGTIFDKFPYLLPNLVCAGFVVISMTIGILFLEETHEDKKDRRDIGLDVGDWLVGRFRSRSVSEKGGFIGEGFHLLAEAVDDHSGHSSTESSPSLAPVSTSIAELPPHSLRSGDLAPLVKSEAAVVSAFTKQVILVIVSYGLLAYHTISAEQLLPVLLSLPKSQSTTHLPFLFTGGFEMSTKSIGTILSLQGVVQAFATLLLFPIVSGKLGHLMTFRIAILSYPLLYILVPYLSVAPLWLRMPGLYFVVIWKVMAQSFALPPIHILLANSAPSKKVLGTLNGTAASSASLCRAIGPTLSGLLQSAGLAFGCLGLPWWTSSVIATMGALLSLCLVAENRRQTAVPHSGAHVVAKADLDMERGQTRVAHGMPVMTRSNSNADVEPLLAMSET